MTAQLQGGKALVSTKSFWGTIMQAIPLLDIAAGFAGYPGLVGGTVSIVSGAAGAILSLWGTVARKEKVTSFA